SRESDHPESHASAFRLASTHVCGFDSPPWRASEITPTAPPAAITGNFRYNRPMKITTTSTNCGGHSLTVIQNDASQQCSGDSCNPEVLIIDPDLLTQFAHRRSACNEHSRPYSLLPCCAEPRTVYAGDRRELKRNASYESTRSR